MSERPWVAFYRLICRHGRPNRPRRDHDKLLANTELAPRLSIATIRETKTNKLLQVVIRYRLFEELLDGEWLDCSAEGLEITGYHILERLDGALNETTIDALKAALGWDGRDPFWLQDAAASLAERPVQVRLGLEEYNGQQNLRVQFLNPYGATPTAGVPQADRELRTAVTNRLGTRFRALAGGTPANPPVPTGGDIPF